MTSDVMKLMKLPDPIAQYRLENDALRALQKMIEESQRAVRNAV